MSSTTEPDRYANEEEEEGEEGGSTTTKIIGIGGASSSGKTTLSRALRDLFRSANAGTVLVHEDDFYLDEQHLPMSASGHRDWDSAESLNIPSLVSTLQYIRSHDGLLPPDLHSIEDQQNMPDPKISTISPLVAGTLRQRILNSGLPLSRIQLAILDGFLLYPPAVSALRAELDVKLFLRTDHATAKKRREVRGGYVTRTGEAESSTLDDDDATSKNDPSKDGGDPKNDIGVSTGEKEQEVNTGYWVDPPGYFDDVVWRNYVRDHGFLFKDGNVEGEFDRDTLEALGIRAMEGFHEGNTGQKRGDGERELEGDGNTSLAEMLEWAVGVILDELGRQRRAGE